MISFQPIIIHPGFVEFSGGFSNVDTGVDDTFFNFVYYPRTVAPEVSSLFDTQLPLGVVSDLDIHFKDSFLQYLSANFAGKHIKKIGLDLDNSGYPDDTAPNLSFYFRDESSIIPITMKRVGDYDFLSFDFTSEQETPLFISRDFSKWKALQQFPLLSYGFYGTFNIKKISLKFADVTSVFTRFWQGYKNCAEGLEELITGEVEIAAPVTYDFVANVSSVGQIEFGDGYFQNVSGEGFTTFPSIQLGGVNCFRCYDTDYFSGLNNQDLAMEVGPFVLKMYLSLDSYTARTEIIGNTFGLDYGMGGFCIFHMNYQFYFARRTTSMIGGFSKTGYTGFAFENNAFHHVEFSIDEEGVFRFFLDGVNKKTEAGCFDVPYQNDGVFLGRSGRYDKTYSPFHIASMAFSKGAGLINKENYIPTPIPY